MPHIADTCGIIYALLALLPIFKLIIGATSLGDCPVQKYIPIFLLVNNAYFEQESGVRLCNNPFFHCELLISLRSMHSRVSGCTSILLLLLCAASTFLQASASMTELSRALYIITRCTQSLVGLVALFELGWLIAGRA
jgi:hypothetical protein